MKMHANIVAILTLILIGLFFYRSYTPEQHALAIAAAILDIAFWVGFTYRKRYVMAMRSSLWVFAGLWIYIHDVAKILLIDADPQLSERALSLSQAVSAEILTASSDERGLEPARAAQLDYVVISSSGRRTDDVKLAELVRNINPHSFVELVEGRSASSLLSRVIAFFQQGGGKGKNRPERARSWLFFGAVTLLPAFQHLGETQHASNELAKVRKELR